jgi:uncharacterized protein (TIGR02145 family)
LYNWYVVKTCKVCPTGWRVPGLTDWAALSNYLGGSYAAPGKLKETGISHFEKTNAKVDNSSGFSAIPAGMRHIFQGYFNDGYSNEIWTTSIYDETMSIHIRLSYDLTYLELEPSKMLMDNASGLSIRCLKN